VVVVVAVELLAMVLVMAMVDNIVVVDYDFCFVRNSYPFFFLS
jgi:hypothetical protein